MKHIERNLGLEINGEPASFHHLHIPPQGAEYTLLIIRFFGKILQEKPHQRILEILKPSEAPCVQVQRCF